MWSWEQIANTVVPVVAAMLTYVYIQPHLNITNTTSDMDIWWQDYETAELRYSFSYSMIFTNLIGRLCFMSHRQRGHLGMAPPFTVPCEGHKARFSHSYHRELNPGRRVAVHYTSAAPPKLHN